MLGYKSQKARRPQQLYKAHSSERRPRKALVWFRVRELPHVLQAPLGAGQCARAVDGKVQVEAEAEGVRRGLHLLRARRTRHRMPLCQVLVEGPAQVARDVAPTLLLDLVAPTLRGHINVLLVDPTVVAHQGVFGWEARAAERSGGECRAAVLAPGPTFAAIRAASQQAGFGAAAGGWATPAAGSAAAPAGPAAAGAGGRRLPRSRLRGARLSRGFQGRQRRRMVSSPRAHRGRNALAKSIRGRELRGARRHRRSPWRCAWRGRLARSARGRRRLLSRRAWDRGLLRDLGWGRVAGALRPRFVVQGAEGRQLALHRGQQLVDIIAEPVGIVREVRLRFGRGALKTIPFLHGAHQLRVQMCVLLLKLLRGLLSNLGRGLLPLLGAHRAARLLPRALKRSTWRHHRRAPAPTPRHRWSRAHASANPPARRRASTAPSGRRACTGRAHPRPSARCRATAAAAKGPRARRCRATTCTPATAFLGAGCG
mmetsp:Transcript_3718/g.13740  ORF Transcript_3718/g.13740 Transcript_3718/m.13740 type:complete len:484 (-) Transcript_3718:728-2179(-)